MALEVAALEVVAMEVAAMEVAAPVQLAALAVQVLPEAQVDSPEAVGPLEQ